MNGTNSAPATLGHSCWAVESGQMLSHEQVQKPVVLSLIRRDVLRSLPQIDVATVGTGTADPAMILKLSGEKGTEPSADIR